MVTNATPQAPRTGAKRDPRWLSGSGSVRRASASRQTTWQGRSGDCRWSCQAHVRARSEPRQLAVRNRGGCVGVAERSCACPAERCSTQEKGPLRSRFGTLNRARSASPAGAGARGLHASSGRLTGPRQGSRCSDAWVHRPTIAQDDSDGRGRVRDCRFAVSEASPSGHEAAYSTVTWTGRCRIARSKGTRRTHDGQALTPIRPMTM